MDGLSIIMSQPLLFFHKTRIKKGMSSDKCVDHHLVVPPDKESTQRCKENAHDEEGGQHRLGCEDGLPCLQALLLEGSVYLQTSTNVSHKLDG